MRILDKYTIKNFLPPVLYCLATFIVMYVIIDLFGHLDEILRNKVGFLLLAKYYYLLIPIIFVQIAPITLLLAVAYAFGNMNRHNEITAMRSCGISIIKIIKPFLLVGISASLGVMLINEMVVPRALLVTTKIKQNYIDGLKGKPKKNTLIADVTIYGQENKLFYVKEFDVFRRKLNEVIILEHDLSNNITSKITAKTGRWENKKWVFYDCIVYKLTENGRLIGMPAAYPRKIMNFKETPKDFYEGRFQADIMNYLQLYEYIKKFSKIDKKITQRLSVNLYHKTAFPFISFVVILLGVGFGLNNRRGGALWGIGVSIAISFVYYGIMAIFLALGKGGWLMPLASAWGANILFLGLGIILLARLTK